MSGGQWMIVLIVLIVLIGVIGGIMKNRHHHDAKSSGGNGAAKAEAAQLRDEVGTLKDRIAVLERVITDNHSSGDLDRQIERLRDQR